MKIAKLSISSSDVVAAQAAELDSAAQDAAGPSGRLAGELGQLTLSFLHVSYEVVRCTFYLRRTSHDYIAWHESTAHMRTG